MLPEQNFSSPDSGVVEDFTPGNFMLPGYFQDHELSNLKSEKIEETTEGD